MRTTKMMGTALVMALALLAWGGMALGGQWNDFVAALNTGNVQRIQKLLNANPKLATMKDDKGWTGLHVVVHDSKLNTVNNLAELLLAKGANPNARNNNGDTPLHLAASANSFTLVKLLVSKGADVNAKGQYGSTALHSAAFYGNKEMAEFLISKGANVNAKGQSDETPLFEGVEEEQKGMVEFLISKGANVNAKDKDKVTPLHQAVFNKGTEIAELLIAKGAEVNARDSDGKTPLYWATPHEEDEEYDIVKTPNPALMSLLRNHGGTE